MSNADNPYRSPMMVELPKDEPLRTVRFAGRYSLKEGLAIALQVEAFWPKFRRMLRYTRCLLPFVFLPLTIIGLMGLDFLVHSGDVMLGLVILSCIALSAFGLVTEFNKQRTHWKQLFAPQDADSTGIFQPFSGSISEQGLEVKQDDLKTRRRWEIYTHYCHSDDVILFWLKDHAEADAVSRTQFESGEDWLRALRMAKHHLPKQPGGAIARG